MKAYKVEVLILDFENYGEEQIGLMLSNVRGIHCSAEKIQSADIGKWSDDSPLNHRSTATAEYNRLFPAPTAAVSAAPSGEVEEQLRGEGWLRAMSDVCAFLPCSYYMDPPDGGSVTVLEQVERMAKDAARYCWLRHGDNDEMVIQHGPVAPDYHWLPRNERLDEMIDAAMAKEKA